MGARVVTVNDVLDEHVALDIQCLDQIYLNAYVPKLQSGAQVVAFLSDHLGYPFPSPALFNQIGQRFRRAMASFAQANDIPRVKFGKDDVGGKLGLMRPHLARQAATGVSGVAAIGFQRVWTAYERQTPTGAPQWWFTKADRRVTCYYFYLWDADFGPAFIKVCSYFSYPAKIWPNGHERAKRQATQAGIGFTELSNGFATCEDPVAVQEICDRLGPGTIAVFVERWLAGLPLPFTTKDRDAGYWWETSMRQIEISRTIVFDAPRHARGFFEALVADNLDLGRPHNACDHLQPSHPSGHSGHLPDRDRPSRQRWGDRQRVLQTLPDQAVPRKTAARCASRPSSTVPVTWAAKPAYPTSTSSRPKAVPATSGSCMLKRVGQGCVLASPAFERIAHPTVDATGRRTPVLRFGDPRVMALTGALCQTLLAATGFTNKNLVLITGLLGNDYRPGQMTYDLHRLRLAELIRRIPHTDRYQLTPEGIRIAVFYTKIHNRMLVPLTAANQPQTPPELRTALATITRHVDAYATHARRPQTA
jgi:hypothetical protein